MLLKILQNWQEKICTTVYFLITLLAEGLKSYQKRLWYRCSFPVNNTKSLIHVRKSLVICVTQFAGGVLLKMLKNFEVALNSIVVYWSVYANKFSSNKQWYFFSDASKRSCCQRLSFFLLRAFKRIAPGLIQNANNQINKVAKNE